MVSEIAARTTIEDKYFHPVDYAIFGIMLSLSAGVGIFYGIRSRKQQSYLASDYLVAGRSMSFGECLCLQWFRLEVPKVTIKWKLFSFRSSVTQSYRKFHVIGHNSWGSSRILRLWDNVFLVRRRLSISTLHYHLDFHTCVLRFGDFKRIWGRPKSQGHLREFRLLIFF